MPMLALRFVLLFITWCALSGLYDLYHLSLGVLSSLWVAAVSTHITLTDRAERPHETPALVLGVVKYALWLVVQVVQANWQVMQYALARDVKGTLTPRVVEFRTRLADDFSRFLLAQSITLTPGTVTIRVDGDRFIVHALTEEMASGVPGEMEDRLVRLFGGEETRQPAHLVDLEPQDEDTTQKEQT